MIDDKTWSDLDCESLLEKLNDCGSLAGTMSLRAMLRDPIQEPLSLRRRCESIAYLRKTSPLRAFLEKRFLKLGSAGNCDFKAFVEGRDTEPVSRLSLVYPALGAFAFVSYFALAFMGAAFIAPVGIITILNFVIHFMYKKRVMRLTAQYSYLNRVLSTGKRLHKIDDPIFRELHKAELARIAAITAKAKKLSSSSSILADPQGGLAQDLISLTIDYLKIILLLEVVAYNRAAMERERLMPEIKEIVGLVGYFDAIVSVGRYLDSAKGFCAATLREGSTLIRARDLGHPLIENPVRNDVELIGVGSVITGTNMSGKSTFLRTLGINSLLAQAFGFAIASSWESGFFIVMTAIASADNLAEAESRYLNEATRILHIIRARESGLPVLALIDEILSGTNSFERSSAAIEILRHLGRLGCLTVAATHDVAIGTTLESLYPNYHFTDTVTRDGLSFDFKLKPGVVKERNAIRLLEYLGYPGAILEALRLGH